LLFALLPFIVTCHENPKRLLQPGLEDRRITIILYLNDAVWEGGSDVNMTGNLRCYLNAEMNDITGVTATEILEIEPRGESLKPKHKETESILLLAAGYIMFRRKDDYI
jgi:hypothetical protein